MKIEFQDRIDEYLQDRMTDEDMKAFEEQVEESEELREQLEFTKDVQATIQSRNKKLAVMSKWEEENMREETGDDTDARAVPANGQTVRFRRLLYWAAGVVAVLVVGIWIANIKHMPLPMEAPEYTDNYGEVLAQIEQKETDLIGELMLLERRMETRGESQEEDAAVQDSLKRQILQLKFSKTEVLIGLGRIDEVLQLLDEIRHSDSEYKIRADSLYRLLENQKRN